MENILLLDTSFASLNKGDDIIMRCVKSELDFLLNDRFVLNLPTHLSPFHAYQEWKNTYRVRYYKNCNYKFACGTNLLVPDLLNRFPQWNINIFNYKPLSGTILVGVGKGAGDKTNSYTTYIYKNMLNNNYYHSVRDERTKQYLESMGLKAYNTGCPTMWMLTPEFCKTIPTKKANNVIFTLTSRLEPDELDQRLIDILISNYNKVYFWPQGVDDYNYLNQFKNIKDISVIQPTVDAYEKVLNMSDIEYVGTRLHGGVFAMRHRKRAIIIVIDERAREINKSNNLNCIEKSNINDLENTINSEVITDIKMPFDLIAKWKSQFK